MFDATLGRFLQRDPAGDHLPDNLYQYVGDRPTGATDPRGLVIEDDRPSSEASKQIEYWDEVIAGNFESGRGKVYKEFMSNVQALEGAGAKGCPTVKVHYIRGNDRPG
jgi:hypothetical protein